LKLKLVDFQDLNARQKENFNFQKISAVFADYGYVTLRLSDDWNGADFIAQHIDGSILRVQLKSRLSFYKRYKGKGLFVAFPDKGNWYLYPHDELLATVLKRTNIGNTNAWLKNGGYSFPGVSKELKPLLAPYHVAGSTKPIPE
jgi:hypothetical protein